MQHEVAQYDWPTAITVYLKKKKLKEGTLRLQPERGNKSPAKQGTTEVV